MSFSGSYVSRALNDHPAISKKTADLIKLKAKELNYKQNTHAANLR
ncbi:MAG TPA: helix-turn-helix domain-containing protein [Arachidicoccus sp.]|nr:helix-turn-helix domain-containing protein [Arachidicoccus sp.]